MSWDVAIALRCDNCGARRAYGIASNPQDNSTDARDAGWHIDGQLAACPDCPPPVVHGPR